MKVLIAAFVISCALGSISALTCEPKHLDNFPTEWIDMDAACTQKMFAHVKEELKAAIQYMAMGAHFSKDRVNRPGFAKLFFKAASEERDHAIQFISYLSMRGGLTENVSNLIDEALNPAITSWSSGASALSDALNLEAAVTKKIRDVIKVCEDGKNDYHLVDHLTGEFLEEQYRGQRDLAGKLSTLQKMMTEYGALGEFLFDKKLLE